MTGHEQFQSNDGVSNNNVVESTSKCLFADAYSGVKCGGRPSTNENEGSAVTQRTNESASNGDMPVRNSGGTNALDNSNHRTQTGGTGYEKPHFPDKDGGKGQFEKVPYDPNMPKNEKFPYGGKPGDEPQKLPNGKPGNEINKFPNDKIPEAHLEKLPKDEFTGGKLEQMPGKLPYGEKEKFPNKMEGQLEKYPDKLEGQLEKCPDKMEGQLDKTGKGGQLEDKINRKGEGGGGGFNDGEGYGGGGGFKDGSQGGGSPGKDFEKHGRGKSNLGPIDKNFDGTIDGTEKEFDKNGNNIIDEHDLNKKIYPSLDRGASRTLPSVGEIAPDINTWSRIERNRSVERGSSSGSVGRRGYDAVPAEQPPRQYRNY